MSKEKGLAGTSPKDKELHQKSTTRKHESQIRVIHVMADGRILESIAGYVVPVNDRTIAAYRIIANQAMERK